MHPFLDFVVEAKELAFANPDAHFAGLAVSPEGIRNGLDGGGCALNLLDGFRLVEATFPIGDGALPFDINHRDTIE